jgi:hypothetical protein
LASKVEGNATIAAQTFTLTSSGMVDGDLSVGAADGIISGAIGRDMAAGVANLSISNQVGRNIEATTETFTLSDTARVQGNISYTSANDLQKDDGAVVGGDDNAQRSSERSDGRV